jgi:Protein of unknown function (DUF1573)
MNRHLKTAILALCAIPFVAASLLAQEAPVKPEAVAVEQIKDVGVVPKGDKIATSFDIRNDGKAPLEITDVRPSCGCTVAKFDRTIAPGQTGKVNVEIDTATFGGPVSKGVTVFTNDPATPQIELTVRADVEPFIQVKPGYARYITVQGEKEKGHIVQTLWAPDGAALEVVKVESPYPYLKVDFHEATAEERMTDAPGRQWRIDMTLDHDAAPVGALAGYLLVHVNHPKQKLVQIPISGFVRPVIAVTPPTANFGSIELKEPQKAVLNIRAFSTEPIRITSIDAGKGVDAQLESVQEGREYQVRLTLKPELGKGPINHKITIHTDSPKKPTIEVDLVGTVL